MLNTNSIDWTGITKAVNSYLQHTLRNCAAEADDLTQDVMLTLWSKLETTEVEDPTRFAIGIAKMKLRDFYRTLQNTRKRGMDELDERKLPIPEKALNPFEALCSAADRSERYAFGIRTYFVQRHQRTGLRKLENCARIAELILNRFDWSEILKLDEFTHLSYDAIKQQWSRCLKDFRQNFTGDLDDVFILG
jgi:hypothetical protein